MFYAFTMIRYPPTSLVLREEDLDCHLERILYQYSLEAEFSELHMDHDDNSQGDDGPESFESYPASPRFRSSSGGSNSDSWPGFDSVATEKATGVSYRNDSNDASTCSSGSRNVPVEIDKGNVSASFDTGPIDDDDIVPVPVSDPPMSSSASSSLAIDSFGISQPSRNVSRIIHSSPQPPIPIKTNVIPAEPSPPSLTQSPEPQSLETALRNISLNASVDGSAPPLEISSDSSAQAIKGPENQKGYIALNTPDERSFCRRTMSPPANKNVNLRGELVPCSTCSRETNMADNGLPQAAPMPRSAPTVVTLSSSSSPLPSQSDSGTDGSKTPQPSQHQTLASHTVPVNDPTSSLSPTLSTTAIFTSTEASPVRRDRSRPRPFPKGFKLSPTSPGDRDESQSPSKDELLVEAKKLQKYFAAMVADLDCDYDADDYGLKEIRHNPSGKVYRERTDNSQGLV